MEIRHVLNLSKKLNFQQYKALHFNQHRSTRPQNVIEFLADFRKEYNLNTPEDWNSVTQNQIKSHGGSSLFHKYSLFDLKCLACPEGKILYEKPISIKSNQKPSGFWNNEENVIHFLNEVKLKYNLQSIDDWNLITQKQIRNLGGGSLFRKYSMFDLKCLACPEGKLKFDNSFQIEEKPKSYWEENENVSNFLGELKRKYNLQNPQDWNSITRTQIKSNGGSSLFHKYSLFDLKCLACPEGKELFEKPSSIRSNQKPPGFWNNEENIIHFLNEVKLKYNLQFINDWNSITYKHIKSHKGGHALLHKYSLFELKSLAFPDEKSIVNNQNKKRAGFWKDKENIRQFLEEIKLKYNFQTSQDWDSITSDHIQSNGGNTLLKHYSLYEIKCMACPEGISVFNKSMQKKIGYWNDKENVYQFLKSFKEKYNLQTPDDWNLISQKHIQLHGGNTLLQHYSLYEIKCLGCPEGISLFEQYQLGKPTEYWENEENRNNFIEKFICKYNLKTPQDWQRVSAKQLKIQGGFWLFYNNMKFLKKCKVNFDSKDGKITKTIKELIEPDKLKRNQKRSSQRWLFLQVQKLFPGEEIVEDYFHSDISRESGFSVQFDVFLIKRNIAIEYHGKQHYEDIPAAFSSLDLYKNRDFEKERLCVKYGIQLIIIPFWWDNKIESLKETLNSKINIL